MKALHRLRIEADRAAVLLLAGALLSSCATVPPVSSQVRSELAPTGKLRAAINFGNPILAARDPPTGEPRGVSVDLSRELARRLGVPVQFVTYDAAGAGNAGTLAEAARHFRFDKRAVDERCSRRDQREGSPRSGSPETATMSSPMSEQSLKKLFENRFGEPPGAIASLKGDASARRLYRLRAPSRTAIGVVGPDDRENRAFLEFSRHFKTCGLPVPKIYAEELDQGIYLEEDLGDTTLFQFLTIHRAAGGPSDETLDLYRKVVEILPCFQIEAGRTLNYDVCHPRASFDKQSMMWDLSYFKYYFLRLAKIPFNEQALENDFEWFTEFLLMAERRHFLYRDFQSRNVMVRGGEPFFIDYQGGRRGALQYDVASLLFDAKADLPVDVRDELVERYLEAASRLESINRKAFLSHYPGFAYIRIMQAMGAYGLRGFYERKQHFLASIPYAIQNLEYLLRTAELPLELPELTQVWRRLVASSSLRQLGTASLKLTVRIESFSYKDGVPTDEKGHGGGYVFDCRALPNPGRFERYAKLTGQDTAVIAFLEGESAVRDFVGHVLALIDQTVENYQQRNFTDLSVAFGCTGGQHRSVYCAERLAQHLREAFPINVEVRHLAQENGPR